MEGSTQCALAQGDVMVVEKGKEVAVEQRDPLSHYVEVLLPTTMRKRSRQEHASPTDRMGAWNVNPQS